MPLRGIPAGTFDMGCMDERDDTDGADCSPVDQPWEGVGLHTVTRDFWCGETEVTQAEFLVLTPGNHNPAYHSAAGGGPDTGTACPPKPSGSMPHAATKTMPTPAAPSSTTRRGT